MFRITAQKKGINAGAVVLAAVQAFVSKDPTRPALHYVNVQGPWLQATDGNRAIRVPVVRLLCAGIPDGSYSVAKDGKDLLLIPQPEAHQFPNLPQIYPSKWTRQFKATVTNGRFTDQTLGSLLFRLARAGVQVNPAFIETLPPDFYTVGITSKLLPIFFGGRDFEAVVMPMRGEKGQAFTFGAFTREPLPEELEAQAAAVPAPEPCQCADPDNLDPACTCQAPSQAAEAPAFAKPWAK